MSGLTGPVPGASDEWISATADMEAALVGGVIMYPNGVGTALAADLGGKHFVDEGLGALWERVRAIALRGDVVDLRTVIQGSMTTIFGRGATFQQVQAQLLALAISPNLVGQYCRLIKASWASRRILSQGDFIRANAMQTDGMQMIERVLSEIDDLRDVTLDRSGSTRGSIGRVVASLADNARAMASGAMPRPPSSGLVTLDKHLPMRGLAGGSLIVLGGRTGMGKTMLAASIANKMSRNDGVAFFSLEVPAAEIGARVVCERLGGRAPSYGEVLAGMITPDEQDKIDEERERVKDLPLYIDDTPALSMADMMVTARREAARFERMGKQLRAVVIDHAQIVKPSARYQGNRVGELGEVANGAKVLAKQLGCAVILGCQVNRSSEGRDDKRPTLADLRASGEIEEAADAVLILYREAYYLAKSQKYAERDGETLNKYEQCKNHVEVGIEKSRQGSTGRVTLWCDPARSIVTDMMGGCR